MARVNRRTFLGGVAAAGAAYALPFGAGNAQAAPEPPRQATLTWLEGGTPATHAGTTWGVPWPRGAFAEDQAFSLVTATGEQVPVQTWATGVWPDGSLKWSAHAISGPTAADGYRLQPGPAKVPAQAVTVEDKAQHVIVRTGVIEVTVRKSGADLIERIVRGGQPVVRRRSCRPTPPPSTASRRSRTSPWWATSCLREGLIGSRAHERAGFLSSRRAAAAA